MARVTVIVPIYNAELYLEKAVRSLMRQTYKDMDIILVDDGSTDTSREIVHKLMEEGSKKITFCAKAHEGVSAARNVGLKLVNSEFVAFADADDWVAPNFVESYVESLKESKCNLSVGAGYYYAKVGEAEKIKKMTKERVLLFKNPTVWLRMYRTEFIRKNKIEFRSFAIGEDLNFTGKLQMIAANAFNLTRQPAAYHYNIRNGSATFVSGERQFELLAAIKDLENFAKKYDYFEQNEQFLEFMVISHVLIAGMKRLAETGMLDQGLGVIMDFVEYLHPHWYQNPYIDRYMDEVEKEYLEDVKKENIVAMKRFAENNHLK